jgi:hypothetical protein
MPTGSEILSRAAILLNDVDHVRWPLAEMRDWLNEGVRAICLGKPSASSSTQVLALQVGTLQKVPVNGAVAKPLSLLGINRNIVDAAEPRKGGRMIKRTDRAILDATEPNWHNRSRVQFSREVRNYCYDELVPLQYYVYPGNDGTGMVEAELATLPPPIVIDPTDSPTDINSYAIDVGLPEPYSVPLLDYVLYRCQLKDDLDGQAGRAAVHYQQFATAIGLKIQVEKAHSPNARP